MKRAVTIIDIANHAGVSFKTVSRVLNENPRVADELRTRVQKAMAELGYQPNLAARALAGRRGYAIALLVDRVQFFNEENANAYLAPYLVDLQAGALNACREAGYHFFVEPLDMQSENLASDLSIQLSKIAVDGVFFALSNMLGREALSVEHFRIVRGELGDDRGADGRERDLFAGISGISGISGIAGIGRRADAGGSA